MNTNELLDLIKARERMCHTITDCDNCPLNNRFCRFDSCYDIDDLNHLISTVKEWDAAHPALEEVGKGKIMNKDCIFYTEIQDMHATISQCKRSTKFADCPCGNDCEHYIPIELARSTDIKPVVKGEWIRVPANELEISRGYIFVNKCSRCGHRHTPENDNFCPNCGAEMRREENNGES